MLTVIRSEDDMREALRQRRQSLSLTQEEAEHRIGLTRGHIGKVEHSDKRKWGKRAFTMTQTLVWMLECYGMHLVLVEAPDDLLDELNRLSRERLGRNVVVSSPRRGRCPKTIDLFRRNSDVEQAA